MHFSDKSALTAFVLAALLGSLAPAAHAQVTLNVFQSGSDVEA